jgi:hypothetical protein
MTKVRKLSRTIKRQDWSKVINTLEHDVTGAQRNVFKIFKKLRIEEKIY